MPLTRLRRGTRATTEPVPATRFALALTLIDGLPLLQTNGIEIRSRAVKAVFMTALQSAIIIPPT